MQTLPDAGLPLGMDPDTFALSVEWFALGVTAAMVVCVGVIVAKIVNDNNWKLAWTALPTVVIATVMVLPQAWGTSVQLRTDVTALHHAFHTLELYGIDHTTGEFHDPDRRDRALEQLAERAHTRVSEVGVADTWHLEFDVTTPRWWRPDPATAPRCVAIVTPDEPDDPDDLTAGWRFCTPASELVDEHEPDHRPAGPSGTRQEAAPWTP
jgi:hypothetical protein